MGFYVHSLSPLVAFSKVEGVILTNAVSRNWQEYRTHSWHDITRNMDLHFVFFYKEKNFKAFIIHILTGIIEDEAQEECTFFYHFAK